MLKTTLQPLPPPAATTERPQRGAVRRYDAPVLTVLKQVWLWMNCICGKRLAAILPEVISVLDQHRELKLTKRVRDKLRQISAATIDRLLAQERQQLNLGSRARTKPGTLLKHQIPIRTFSQWDEARPGFVEIDLVAILGFLEAT